jgi:anti-sigma factor RsiW
VNGSILPFEGRRHVEAQRLLPWLLSGRLDDDERAWLEPHMAGCGDCRRELEQLRALRDACAQAGDDVPGGGAGDVFTASSAADRGWRRLRPLLQPSRPQREEAWRRPTARRPRWLGWAIAAQAATLAALAFALWQQPAPARYRTLGATPAAPTGNLVIAFDPRLDEAHLRSLLLASQARIVDGPNDAGAYVLSVPPARLALVRDALRAAPGVTLVAGLAPASRQ